MKQIKFFDTTLRDGEQTPGASLSVNEKVQIARQLERLRVDIIEAGFAVSSPGDFAAVHEIAKVIGPEVTVASLSRALRKDIDASYEALKPAKNPRIHLFIATSDVHMQYKLKMTPEQVLESAVESVKYAKKYCGDVQFSAEDAGRSRPEFLREVLEAVIEAGATVVNIPDTVGYNSPAEFGNLIRYLRENVPNIHKADIAVHCHNDLGLAVANTLAAAMNGATQLECTINGLGERAGNTSLEEVVMNLAVRKDFYSFEHRLDTSQIYRTSRLVSSLTGVEVQPNKAIVGANAFSHESGIHQHGMLANASTYEIMTPESVGVPSTRLPLGKLSGKHAFTDKIIEMGFTLSQEKLSEVFEQFKALADRKKTVSEADIEALILDDGTEPAQAAYELDSYQSLGGNKLVATATVTIKQGDALITKSATGNGPVEAAYGAINKAIGFHPVLESYVIRAVTEGSDALGEVAVKITHEGKTVSGRGVSTDVIESSIRSYISALNKL